MKQHWLVLKDHLLPIMTSGLFVIFIVTLPRYSDFSKTWIALLLLISLIHLMLNPRLLRITAPPERLFFTLVLVNFIWIAFTFYANGEPGRGASTLWNRHFYFLSLIPLYFLFRRVEITDRVIVLTLCASVTLSLGDILIDLSQNIDHRIQGMNPNKFGPIQLCLTAMLFFYYLENPDKQMRWISLCGAVLGLATVLFSMSRNTWLTLAILSVAFVFYLTRSLNLSKRIALVAGFLILTSASYFLPIVENRIDNGLQTIDAYFSSDDYRDDKRLGSFGKRMELWKTGWYIFLENPFLGVGVGGFKVTAAANSERYQVNDYVKSKRYVHNQYLAALATRGLPGLVLFLLVMTIPIYIAMRAKSDSRSISVARMSIVFICLVYLIGCLFEDHFEGKSSTMFVGLMLPLLLARIAPSTAADPG